MSLDSVLLDIAPELSTYTEDERSRFLGYASAQVKFASDNAELQELAIAYLAAHMMTFSKRSGTGGQVVSEREGDLSRSYSQSSSSNAYESTSYGQEYLRIRSMFVMGMLTRAC